MEQTPNKSQHTKLTQEKTILPPLLPGFELATFRPRVRRSNQQAIPAINYCQLCTSAKLTVNWDLLRNQLWQRWEEECRKPRLGVRCEPIPKALRYCHQTDYVVKMISDASQTPGSPWRAQSLERLFREMRFSKTGFSFIWLHVNRKQGALLGTGGGGGGFVRMIHRTLHCHHHSRVIIH